jgi:hypothetical protein
MLKFTETPVTVASVGIPETDIVELAPVDELSGMLTLIAPLLLVCGELFT